LQQLATFLIKCHEVVTTLIIYNPAANESIRAGTTEPCRRPSPALGSFHTCPPFY